MLDDIIKKWSGVEVTAMDVYTTVFRLGQNLIQKDGEAKGQYKANPLAYWRTGTGKGQYRIMFDDTFEETLKELQEADFSILNGLTYFGRKNVQEHASKMYAMIFDLDGVTDKTLNAFLSGAIKANAYPVPNYVIMSGHGVHLYYVFQEPISLFPNMKLQLKELKYALTEKMWNMYTSTEKYKQFQGINQGFRVIGGKTKIDGIRVRAFALKKELYVIQELCNYVSEEHRIDEKKLWRESKISLQEAKVKYPKWYEKVVLNKQKDPTKWDISGKVHGNNPYALYDWWKRKIYTGATYHHRYFAIMCLAIYGVKCDVPFEQVQQDAYELIPYLNDINPDDPFKKQDCDAALECYDKRYCTFPIKDIEKLSNITIKKNKRNGRKKEAHVKMLNEMRRFKRDVLEEDEYKNNGRPSKEQLIIEYLQVNQDKSVTEIAKQLGVSRTTVYKYKKSLEE
jgi:DNA-binding phage protein